MIPLLKIITQFAVQKQKPSLPLAAGTGLAAVGITAGLAAIGIPLPPEAAAGLGALLMGAVAGGKD
jgi:hypothetical protein